MDNIFVFALFISSLICRWVLSVPVTVSPYRYNTDRANSIYRRYDTTPAPYKLPNRHPNSYYSRLISSEQSERRAAQSNSKFLGYSNQESSSSTSYRNPRVYHRRRRPYRPPCRKRSSQANYSANRGRNASDGQGRFWGVNVYNFHPANTHPDDYRPSDDQYRPAEDPVSDDYYRPSRPRPQYDDNECDDYGYADEYDRPVYNNFLNQFRPGGIFYQPPYAGSNLNRPLSDENGNPDAGAPPPTDNSPGPSQIVGGLASYVNTVIQTIVGNARPSG